MAPYLISQAAENHLLETNPKVDRELIKRFAELEKQLRRLGVDTKPKYTLRPPLGDRPIQCFNSPAARESPDSPSEVPVVSSASA
jgi:hypothetical protein